jgi:hypothetical protein
MKTDEKSPLATTLQTQQEHKGRVRIGEYAHLGLVLCIVLAHVFLIASISWRFLFPDRA